MPALDFLDISAQDRRFFGAFGGRLMAIVAITVLVWLLLVDERDEARHKVYEGTAWGLGWALARLADAPRPGDERDGP